MNSQHSFLLLKTLYNCNGEQAVRITYIALWLLIPSPSILHSSGLRFLLRIVRLMSPLCQLVFSSRFQLLLSPFPSWKRAVKWRSDNSRGEPSVSNHLAQSLWFISYVQLYLMNLNASLFSATYSLLLSFDSNLWWRSWWSVIPKSEIRCA